MNHDSESETGDSVITASKYQRRYLRYPLEFRRILIQNFGEKVSNFNKFCTFHISVKEDRQPHSNLPTLRQTNLKTQKPAILDSCCVKLTRSSFSKSFILKMFSVQTKTRSWRFQIPPVWRAFRKAPFVDGLVWTASLTVEINRCSKFLRHIVDEGLKINECTNSGTRAHKNCSRAPQRTMKPVDTHRGRNQCL